jgi:capsular exopolysaccharide synthesis family protein
MIAENNHEQIESEEGFDFQKIIYLLMRHWQWFLISGAIGLTAAYVYTKLTKPVYTVTASILVPEKSSGLGIDMTKMMGVGDLPQNNIYNQIEILTSYYPINQTLLNLGWGTSWSKKELFVWNGIYKQEPFVVAEAPSFVNLRGVPIQINPTTADGYNLSINGKTSVNGVPTEIRIEGKGIYGQPFINTWFNFTLRKKPNIDKVPDGSYRFVFNDLNQTTLAYRGKVKASLKTKMSDIIQCTIQGDEPVKDGEFLNELLKVYIGNKMDLQNEAQKRSLDFINSQLTGISDSMNSASTRFANFRSQNNVIDITAEGTMVMNNLQSIESERAKSQMQLDYFNNILNYLNEPGNQKQLVSPSVVGIGDAALNGLVAKLGELYNRRQVISFSTKENNPALALIDKELAQTRSQLTENLRNLIDNASRSITSLKDRQAGMSTELNKLPQKEQQMIDIQRQFNVTNDLYTFLLKKRAETNITLASSVPDVQIIDVARPDAASRIGLSRSIILLIGLFLGIGIPLAVMLLLNMFDVHIRTQEDVENKTRIPIIGNIIHENSDTTLIVHENPKSIIAESFRALRTNLQYMVDKPTGKVISVQSTHPGEGKTFVSINLASILAMNDKKVLLIGVDLRKPKIHKVFDLKNDHGLSTYLAGYDPLDQLIVPTPIQNLSLLPSGPIPPNPAELLGRQEMKALIEKLRLTYDYIVLDNAPISFVTDGLIMSQLSDLNIFILRYGTSRKQQIDIINHHAEKKLISHVAIVVNDIKPNSFGYAYSKYSRYDAYYKYSYQKNYHYTSDESDGKVRRKREPDTV